MYDRVGRVSVSLCVGELERFESVAVLVFAPVPRGRVALTDAALCASLDIERRRERVGNRQTARRGSGGVERERTRHGGAVCVVGQETH
jgi:hypothetical protein